MSKVSVVIPIYNSSKYLRESLDSILAQTFEDWELLAINEYGSNDGSAEIVREYELKDSRVHLIQNERKLGLAESLNKGIRLAQGEYIARMDADDLAHAERFAKQVKLLDENSNVIVCGTYQHHFGSETNWIHKPAVDAAQCRANLLFFCDLCHSTLMLRKNAIEEHQLWYDNQFLAEDYELWTRVAQVGDIVNIPEVLGEYRIGENNITNEKKERLNIESGKITLRSLRENMGLELDEEKALLFQGWANPFAPENAGERRTELLQALESTLRLIYRTNKEAQYYGDKELLRVVATKWYWAKYYEPFNQLRNVDTIDEIFNKNYNNGFWRRLARFCKNNKGIRVKGRKVFGKIKEKIKMHQYKLNSYNREYIDSRITELSEKLDAQTYELERHINDMTWDRCQVNQREITRTIQYLQMVLQMNIARDYSDKKVPYYKGEKIRIIFLFQVASFWPSWDTLLKACKEDERFDVKLLYLNETVVETSQMKTAECFLREKHIAYEDANEFDIDMFGPHIIVFQTPYDFNHRKVSHRSSAMKAKGYRVVYVPYGIEIADTKMARVDHFTQHVILNHWRLYTFSERMRQDYLLNVENPYGVRAVGHPKFDALYCKEDFKLSDEIVKRALGRKIVLWKVHFPKIIFENGEKHLTTPDLSEYIKFAEELENQKDLFFVFMPHPKLFDENIDEYIAEDINKLLSILEQKENVFIDMADDYRFSLLNSDYIMVDRSAVMIEAGAVGVPVLYMRNERFEEPMTAAVKPLVESYYQGSTCEDMITFLHMCRNKLDPKGRERQEKFKMCIPFFDGQCGERIKNDIAMAIYEEAIERSL